MTDPEERLAALMAADANADAARWAAARKSWEFGNTRDGEGEHTNAKPGNVGNRPGRQTVELGED